MMSLLINIVVLLVAGLHLSFLAIEIFYWDKPLGMKIFRLSKEQANSTKLLAANQGLYNGFLAAGLLWGILEGNVSIKVFFLSCVIVAGIFGALTVNKRIFLVQALPAIIALVLIFF